MDHRSQLRRGFTEARGAQEAAAALRASIGGDDIGFALIFCSPHYDLDELSAALRREFAGTLLYGCTTAGEITPCGYMTGSLTGIGFPRAEFAVSATLIEDLRNFEMTAGIEAARQMLRRHRDAGSDAASPARDFALVFVDGLSVREEQVVSAIANGLGGLPLVGGSAGDGLSFGKTFVLHEGRFVPDAATLIVVSTTRPFRVFRSEHFVATDRKMVVTGADPARRIVTEINAAPAASEYARLVGLSGEELTPMIFAAHPVVVKVGGQYHVRAIQKVNDDESLTFFCAIEEGIVLTVAEGVDIVQNLEGLFARLSAEIGPPDAVLGCDCVLRSLEIEQRQVKRAVSRILARNRVVGFCSYGEQYNAMHVNQTLTGIAFGAGEGI